MSYGDPKGGVDFFLCVLVFLATLHSLGDGWCDLYTCYFLQVTGMRRGERRGRAFAYLSLPPDKAISVASCNIES